jgi:hypothetical protein
MVKAMGLRDRANCRNLQETVNHNMKNTMGSSTASPKGIGGDTAYFDPAWKIESLDAVMEMASQTISSTDVKRPYFALSVNIKSS